MTTETEPAVDDLDDEAIHGYFGLTYSNYQVLHRTLMQSMPAEWQRRAVAVFEELREAYGHIEHAEAYIVTAAVESTYGELTDAAMATLGVTRGDADEDEDAPEFFYDRYGDEHAGWERVLVPAPGGDPIPHYNRGRTRIEPRLKNEQEPCATCSSTGAGCAECQS